MAMTVSISLLTGAGPSFTEIGASTAVWNRVDSLAGTTVIPTPVATGTNFSWVKSFQVNITAVGGLSMTNILFGKVAGEATTGTKLWYRSDHAAAGYTQATTAPGATGDNNVTAPAMNGTNAAVAAVPLISAPPATYAAGPFNTVARHGNLIEVCLGVDFTNATAGSAVSTPTLRWSWTES